MLAPIEAAWQNDHYKLPYRKIKITDNSVVGIHKHRKSYDFTVFVYKKMSYIHNSAIFCRPL